MPPVRLKAGGADFIVIASNTLNSRADDIEARVGIPVLRIYDVTGAKVNRSGLKKVALLGTKFTMEQPFYRDVLKNKYGIEVVTPNATERDYINTVIFDELVRDDIRNESRAETSGSSTVLRTRREHRGLSLDVPRSRCSSTRAM